MSRNWPASVRISEGADNRGPDNRGSTVVTPTTGSIDRNALSESLYQHIYRPRFTTLYIGADPGRGGGGGGQGIRTPPPPPYLSYNS